MSETYGSLLRKIRKEAELTQPDLAAILDLSGQAVCSIESSLRSPFSPIDTRALLRGIGKEEYLDELLTLEAEHRQYVEFIRAHTPDGWELLVKLRNKILLGNMSPEEWEAIEQIVSEECHV